LIFVIFFVIIETQDENELFEVSVHAPVDDFITRHSVEYNKMMASSKETN